MSTDSTRDPAEPEDSRDEAAPPQSPPAADELPAAVLRMWGAEVPRRRGPKPVLSTAQVVQAALDLADAEGLAAVSMARVAEAVGYTPMALYRHVSGKEELLVLMSDAVARFLPDLPLDTGWRAGLEAWTRIQIEWVIARPWILELPLSSVAPGPNRVRWMDQAFGVLEQVDLPADEKLAIVGLLAQHVLGEARVQSETRRTAVQKVRHDAGLPDGTPESELDPAAIEAANPWADFETVLTQYAGPTAYPHLFGAFATWSPPVENTSAEDDIAFGITVVLDGIEAYLKRRGAIPDAGS